MLNKHPTEQDPMQQQHEAPLDIPLDIEMPVASKVCSVDMHDL